MWNRTANAQSKARLAAGTCAALAIVILPFTTSGPGNPLALTEHVSTAVGSIVGSQSRLLPVDFGANGPEAYRPRLVSSLSGTLVFAETADGTGSIVGTLVSHGDQWFIALRPDVADQLRDRVDLLYAGPIYSFDDALALLCAPEGLAGELELARESLLPVIRQNILDPMQVRLREELTGLVAEIPDMHADEIEQIATDLRRELDPEIGSLTSKLAEAAWDEVGVIGVAEGVGRGALNTGEAAWGWTKRTVGGLFGGDDKEEPKESESSKPRDFLSDDRKQRIAAAVTKEAATYWEANREGILAKAGRVLGKYEANLAKAFEEKWLPRLYDRVVKSAWEMRGDAVDQALRNYAEDFATRRLTAGSGGPTLALAYAVRSGTGITDHPLFVIRKRTDDSGGPAKVLPYATHRPTSPSKPGN